jgi:hypothetical protein
MRRGRSCCLSELHKLLAVSAIAPCLAFAGPGLDQAEVKLPYGELKSLITAANRPPPEIKSAPISALLAMRFRLSLSGKTPVLDSTFRTSTFSDGLAMVPLVGGDVTIENQKPPDARILISEKKLCQALEKTGTQVLEMRLLPSFGKNGANLSIPACPASLFETGDLGAEWSVALTIDGKEHVLGSRVELPGCVSRAIDQDGYAEVAECRPGGDANRLLRPGLFSIFRYCGIARRRTQGSATASDARILRFRRLLCISLVVRLSGRLGSDPHQLCNRHNRFSNLGGRIPPSGWGKGIVFDSP